MTAVLAVGALVVAGFVIFCVVAGVVYEWVDHGPFRSLAYILGWLPVWAIYDEVKTYVGRRCLLGFSRSDFDESFKSGSAQPASSGLDHAY